MLIEQIDRVDREPLQRTFDRFADVFGPAIQFRTDLFSVLDAEAELRRDHDPIALARERAPEQQLVGVRTVDLRRIEERATQVDRAMNRRDRLGLVGGAIGLAHAHAAQTYLRYFESPAAELAYAQRHRVSPLRENARRNVRGKDAGEGCGAFRHPPTPERSPRCRQISRRVGA